MIFVEDTSKFMNANDKFLPGDLVKPIIEGSLQLWNTPPSVEDDFVDDVDYVPDIEVGKLYSGDVAAVVTQPEWSHGYVFVVAPCGIGWIYSCMLIPIEIDL